MSINSERKYAVILNTSCCWTHWHLWLLDSSPYPHNSACKNVQGSSRLISLFPLFVWCITRLEPLASSLCVYLGETSSLGTAQICNIFVYSELTVLQNPSDLNACKYYGCGQRRASKLHGMQSTASVSIVKSVVFSHVCVCVAYICVLLSLFSCFGSHYNLIPLSICSQRRVRRKKGGEVEELAITLHPCPSSSCFICFLSLSYSSLPASSLLLNLPIPLSSPSSPACLSSSPLSSSVRASMELSFIWKPSRCVVCLIVRKCVWVCKMCFKVLRVRAFFSLASHTVPVSVATVCSVPVWDISFPQGRPGPFPLSAAANQPSSASIIY